MDRIYESVIIINNRLEGLLTRLDYLSSEMSSPSPASPLLFVSQTMDPKNNILTSDKNFNEFFALDSRDLRKAALKPHLETLQEVVSVTDTVVLILTKMQTSRVHLDLNINPSLAFPVLSMVASLASLLILLVSSLLPVARAVITIYQRLTHSQEEALRGLELFLASMQPHPIEALQELLAPFKDMLSTGITSATKVLDRGSQQLGHQLNNLLISQAGLQDPCHVQNSSAGHRDTLQPIEVARVAFLSFLAVSPSWETKSKAGKTDLGFKVLESILTSGWMVTLFRDHSINPHTILANCVKRSKDKNKGAKKRQLETWEEEALKAPTVRREERRKLALLLEDYCILMEDQPLLVGPRILLLMTLLAQASHEISWLVCHQNGSTRRKMDKANEEAMTTDQETILILQYIVRMRQMLKQNEDGIKNDMAFSIQEELNRLQGDQIEGVKLAALDLSTQCRGLLGTVGRTVSAISTEEREGRSTVTTGLHRYDLGRLITSLSCRPLEGARSSPAQMCPQLLSTLELVFMKSWLLQDPVKVAKKISNMNILYFFKDTFEDYFAHLLGFDTLLSCSIAFPTICEDFTSALHSDCPEEFDSLIADTTNLVNVFIEKMATTAVRLIESYCTEIAKQEQEDINLMEAAKLYCEKEREGRRKERERTGEQKQEDRSKRRKTIKKKETGARKVIFDSLIEKITIGMKQLFTIFRSETCLSIAGLKFFPTAAFLDKLYEKILDTTRGLIRLDTQSQAPALPSSVLRNLRTYQAALVNIDPGLHFSTMAKEALFSIRTEDPHPYLVTYCSKVLGTLSSPQCYFCPASNSFLALSTDLQLVSDPIEVLTSVQELEALCQIFGAEGMLWLGERVDQTLSEGVDRLKKALNCNSLLLSSPMAREKEGAWKTVTNIPEILAAAIEVGKTVALADLMDAANYTVTRDRAGLLEAALANVYSSEQSQLLGIPDCLLPIGAAMGYPKTGGQNDQDASVASQLLTVISVLLPLLAKLETTRYFPHVMTKTSNTSTSSSEPAPALEIHQSSLHCLAQALRYLTGDDSTVESSEQQLVRSCLHLSSPVEKGGVGALLLARALLPQVCGLPDSLMLTVWRSAQLDNSHVTAMTLEAELASRKVTKLFKK